MPYWCGANAALLFAGVFRDFVWKTSPHRHQFRARIDVIHACELRGVGSGLEKIAWVPVRASRTSSSVARTDIAKRLPVGFGDEQRLTQVLLNLVGNAIKFTDSGEVRITATAVNGHFTVGVTDTGPGIPAEEQKRVFEQFHQIDNSNTKAKGGTGLGLAIAKQIIEMHGGRIWVESALGEGATFHMELPVRAETRKGASGCSASLSLKNSLRGILRDLLTGSGTWSPKP
jgi:signal transduction histidine kinase